MMVSSRSAAWFGPGGVHLLGQQVLIAASDSLCGKVACQHRLEMDHHWQVRCGPAVQAAAATQPVQLPRSLEGRMPTREFQEL